MVVLMITAVLQVSSWLCMTTVAVRSTIGMAEFARNGDVTRTFATLYVRCHQHSDH